ncbi:MAG: chemotaxis protein CheW [Pseudomonadales bacterium]
MKQALQVDELPAELVTFLMPVTKRYLLLPNVTVAEIIHHRAPKQPDDMPTWFLGHLEWRGQKVPMVSFEALNEEPFQADGRRQNIAVLNGITDPEKLPFLAVLTQGAPRLMRLTPDEITGDSSQDRKGPAELMVVSANGETASIPDLSFMERSVMELDA